MEGGQEREEGSGAEWKGRGAERQLRQAASSPSHRGWMYLLLVLSPVSRLSQAALAAARSRIKAERSISDVYSHLACSEPQLEPAVRATLGQSASLATPHKARRATIAYHTPTTRLHSSHTTHHTHPPLASVRLHSPPFTRTTQLHSPTLATPHLYSPAPLATT